MVRVVFILAFLLSFSAYVSPVNGAEMCLMCHQDPDIAKEADGGTVSLFVDEKEFTSSVHGMFSCSDCHQGLSEDEIPHAPKIEPVECRNCHTGAEKEYQSGGHSVDVGGGPAATCADCHGVHDVKGPDDEKSPVYRMNLASTCGKCHRKTGKASVRVGKEVVDVFHDYTLSVHGRGVEEKGLIVSAVCVDCHGSHKVLPAKNQASKVHPDNIPGTCGSCHKGILDKYRQGIHLAQKGKSIYPVCSDCHSAHQISHIDENEFLMETAFQCGNCHRHITETYLQTYHGKAYELGYARAAKCSDCHDPHHTLRVKDPDSRVGGDNRLATCRKCHASATEKFTGYITHLTPENSKLYPQLHWVYLFMEGLLYGVFGFFGLHTLLWIPRSFASAAKHGKPPMLVKGRARYFRRFSLSQRLTHVFVIISFLTLAVTGMMLKFAGAQWAQVIAALAGGVTGAGLLHRFAAIITFGYFFYHLWEVWKLKRESGESWYEFLLGTESMVPSWKDFDEFYRTIKWFMWMGPRPRYGRWTYWEKFDYFAVFWGVAIIGSSGLVLWFPEFFTRWLPGWSINIAHIIHSEEALLAVGFIFTIHFFHTHLRPEAFPMDPVIFSGVVEEGKYRRERPADVDNLEKAGKLSGHEEEKEIPEKLQKLYYGIGGLFLFCGVLMILLIFYAALFGG